MSKRRVSVSAFLVSLLLCWSLTAPLSKASTYNSNYTSGCAPAETCFSNLCMCLGVEPDFSSSDLAIQCVANTTASCAWREMCLYQLTACLGDAAVNSGGTSACLTWASSLKLSSLTVAAGTNWFATSDYGQCAARAFAWQIATNDTCSWPASRMCAGPVRTKGAVAISGTMWGTLFTALNDQSGLAFAEKLSDELTAALSSTTRVVSMVQYADNITFGIEISARWSTGLVTNATALSSPLTNFNWMAGTKAMYEGSTFETITSVKVEILSPAPTTVSSNASFTYYSSQATGCAPAETCFSNLCICLAVDFFSPADSLDLATHCVAKTTASCAWREMCLYQLTACLGDVAAGSDASLPSCLYWASRLKLSGLSVAAGVNWFATSDYSRCAARVDTWETANNDTCSWPSARMCAGPVRTKGTVTISGTMWGTLFTALNDQSGLAFAEKLSSELTAALYITTRVVSMVQYADNITFGIEISAPWSTGLVTNATALSSPLTNFSWMAGTKAMYESSTFEGITSVNVAFRTPAALPTATSVGSTSASGSDTGSNASSGSAVSSQGSNAATTSSSTATSVGSSSASGSDTGSIASSGSAVSSQGSNAATTSSSTATSVGSSSPSGSDTDSIASSGSVGDAASNQGTSSQGSNAAAATSVGSTSSYGSDDRSRSTAPGGSVLNPALTGSSSTGSTSASRSTSSVSTTDETNAPSVADESTSSTSASASSKGSSTSSSPVPTGTPLPSLAGRHYIRSTHRLRLSGNHWRGILESSSRIDSVSEALRMDLLQCLARYSSQFSQAWGLRAHLKSLVAGSLIATFEVESTTESGAVSSPELETKTQELQQFVESALTPNSSSNSATQGGEENLFSSVAQLYVQEAVSLALVAHENEVDGVAVLSIETVPQTYSPIANSSSSASGDNTQQQDELSPDPCDAMCIGFFVGISCGAVFAVAVIVLLVRTSVRTKKKQTTSGKAEGKRVPPTSHNEPFHDGKEKHQEDEGEEVVKGDEEDGEGDYCNNEGEGEEEEEGYGVEECPIPPSSSPLQETPLGESHKAEQGQEENAQDDSEGGDCDDSHTSVINVDTDSESFQSEEEATGTLRGQPAEEGEEV